MKVNLPKFESKLDATAHIFPIQIAYQAQEFMQGAIFYYILSDTAASQRVRQPKALDDIEQTLLDNGMSKSQWNEGWNHLDKYQDVFAKNVRQSVLITLRSHWDWYISHLGAFINSNYSYKYSKGLSKSKQKELSKIGFKEITQQIKILNNSIESEIHLDETTLEHVREMSLVRNLGLHNRWEVDKYYLESTKTTGWNIREIRTFEIGELEQWHSALVELINQSWKPVAIILNGSPEYII
ncbi:MAG: hypothetical protein AB2799_11895 [Candidatus Thiodiazotropha sp.]